MKEEYNFSAATYDTVLYLALQPIRQVVLNELLEHKDKTILDLCCGTGSQLKLLSKHGFSNLHCLDLSQAMLRVAKKGDHLINVYNQDAAKTDFANASFDILIISFAIHEKNRETQEKMLNEAYRLLNQDGLIVIVDYVFDDKTKMFGRVGIRLIEQMAGGEHYRNFKGYIQNHGLASLVKNDKFKFIKNNRMAFNGVTVSMYQKILNPSSRKRAERYAKERAILKQSSYSKYSRRSGKKLELATKNWSGYLSLWMAAKNYPAGMWRSFGGAHSAGSHVCPGSKKYRTRQIEKYPQRHGFRVI